MDRLIVPSIVHRPVVLVGLRKYVIATGVHRPIHVYIVRGIYC